MGGVGIWRGSAAGAPWALRGEVAISDGCGIAVQEGERRAVLGRRPCRNPSQHGGCFPAILHLHAVLLSPPGLEGPCCVT